MTTISQVFDSGNSPIFAMRKLFRCFGRSPKVPRLARDLGCGPEWSTRLLQRVLAPGRTIRRRRICNLHRRSRPLMWRRDLCGSRLGMPIDPRYSASPNANSEIRSVVYRFRLWQTITNRIGSWRDETRSHSPDIRSRRGRYAVENTLIRVGDVAPHAAIPVERHLQFV